MRRALVVQKIKSGMGDLNRLGVKSLSLFGSVSRDEATPKSDIDVLVDFSQPLTFDRYMSVKFYLEDLLKRRVDLVSRQSLKPKLRQRVERDLINVT